MFLLVSYVMLEVKVDIDSNHFEAWFGEDVLFFESQFSYLIALSGATRTPGNMETERVIVKFPYQGENADELNINKGDIIIVLDKDLEDDGWWKGELNGRVGVFPDNFVEPLPASAVAPSLAKEEKVRGGGRCSFASFVFFANDFSAIHPPYRSRSVRCHRLLRRNLRHPVSSCIKLENFRGPVNCSLRLYASFILNDLMARSGRNHWVTLTLCDWRSYL